MDYKERELIEFERGDIALWIGEGGSSIMLKAVTKQYGDPVEICSPDTARELAEVLKKMASQIE